MTDSTSTPCDHDAFDGVWPAHMTDTGSGFCSHGGEARRTGATTCPAGCSGSVEHYANDGHADCAEEVVHLMGDEVWQAACGTSSVVHALTLSTDIGKVTCDACVSSLAIYAEVNSDDDIELAAYTSWAESVRATGHVREEYIGDFPTWRVDPIAPMLIRAERDRREAAAREAAGVIASVERAEEPF